MTCNRDCFNCTFADCIVDDVTKEEERTINLADKTLQREIRRVERYDSEYWRQNEKYQRYYRTEKFREAQRKYNQSEKGKQRSKKFADEQKRKKLMLIMRKEREKKRLHEYYLAHREEMIAKAIQRRKETKERKLCEVDC